MTEKDFKIIKVNVRNETLNQKAGAYFLVKKRVYFFKVPLWFEYARYSAGLWSRKREFITENRAKDYIEASIREKDTYSYHYEEQQ